MILNKKASPVARDLLEKMSPFITFQTYPAGKQLYFIENDIRKCYFMRQGVVLLYRGSEEGVLIGSFAAPFVAGLGEYHEEISSFKLVTTQACEIAELTRDETFDIVEKNNFWQLVAQQMQYVSERLMKYAELISAPSAYEIISIQLRLLMNEPLSLRSAVPAEKYIRSKTSLSRSGTMRILSALKAGGYIEIEDGILIDIRHLPAKY